MGWVSGIAVYVIIWWTVLFAVLPWGIRPAEDPVPGEMPGAPENPRLWTKAGVTTAISAVVWGVVYLLVDSNLISFREMAERM